MVLTPFTAFAIGSDSKDPVYTRFEGRVSEIHNNYPLSNRIRIESDKDYGLFDFIITENTLFMTEGGPRPLEEISINDRLVVYFIEPMLSPSVFPPIREASVFVRVTDENSLRSVFVGRFDENLLSDDNSLKLNISDNTVIVNANGKDATGTSLEGRDLAVAHSIVTMSIPAQTTPELIVILEQPPEMPGNITSPGENGYVDINVGGPLELDQETIDKLSAQLAEDLRGAPITVRGEKIDAPEPYVRNNWVFLPLRAVAEALGYEVFWEAETSSIALGVGIRLQIGSYEYTVGRMAPITLNNAPIIVNGLTYVPLEFFGEVLGLDASFMIQDGHGEIIIADRE